MGMVFKTPEMIHTPLGIESVPLPEIPIQLSALPFPPGEAEAQRRLESFIHTPWDGFDPDIPRIEQYASRRDRIDLECTSGLSPYLRFGMISIRQVVAAAMHALRNAPDVEAFRGAEVWLSELIWRDFYIHVIFHFPRIRKENFRLHRVKWQNNQDEFTAWCTGRTGYPIVDAAMRQLRQCGWMHNRARMITASFLTKDLLIDWRWGERWFMQHLVDGDPAANNGGWQWSAGTGTDAAPYFRIFNPIIQSTKYDPNGNFIHRWIPELTQVPSEFIHQPWIMPPKVQEAAGCIIGVDYPAPIFNHAWARERALHAYGK
jgi:deoxyribodipyrimidine photo-lyase